MARGSPRHVTDEHRVADLHARGFGRNAIARGLGLAAGTITIIATDLGLSFDRCRRRTRPR